MIVTSVLSPNLGTDEGIVSSSTDCESVGGGGGLAAKTVPAKTILAISIVNEKKAKLALYIVSFPLI